MYEISSFGGNMLYGDGRLKLDYKFVVDRAGFYSQQPNKESLDLMVKIQNSRIYYFCNGMIERRSDNEKENNNIISCFFN